MSFPASLQSNLIKRALSVALTGGSNGHLSVFTFHKVPMGHDPLVPDELNMDAFEKIIDFLQHHTQVLPLGDAVNSLRAGTLPKRAVALTFDDGYAEWSANVADALWKRSLPATFFVSTEILDGIPNWHERIVEAVRKLPDEGLRLPAGTTEIASLASIESRIRLIRELQNRLKYVHLEERLQAIALLEAQSVSALRQIPAFAASDIRFLHSKGFDIGGHTMRHPILTKCSDAEAIKEIAGCKEALESMVGGKVKHFAYPNGRPGLDYEEKHAAMVKNAGYTAAFSTSTGLATRESNIFQLPRAAPWASTPIRMAIQLARNRTSKPRTLTA